MARWELVEVSARIEAGLLAVPVFEEELASGLASELDRALDGQLLRAARDARFKGKPDATLLLPTLGRLPAARILLLGLGPRAGAAAIAAGGFERLRMAAGTAARAGLAAGAEALAFAVPEGLDPAGAARAAVEGALLGAYRFDRHRSRRADADPPRALRKLTVALPRSAGSAAVREAARLGEWIAEAVALARDLVNEPPRHLTPARLAREAQAMARTAGLGCEVLGPRQLEKLGMGMFLGVARGSAEEPRLVKLTWKPRAARGGGRARRGSPRPLVLVGKGITFDSGGLSLKPTDSMVTMNDDMAGSAAVLAALRVVARLAPPFPVIGLLGACENMPGGRAYKPSDVLTAWDGQTVEVTNTDAEGRLVLGDLLAWARGTLGPAALVDVATLTGACVVALGNYTTGAFGPDGAAMDAVLAAARAAGEDTWRLPLVPEVRDTLKSDVADMKNTGERWGGAISAAHFLQAFAGDVPWVHLDIAGPAHAGKDRGYVSQGGTGAGVRTLVELVRAWRPRA